MLKPGGFLLTLDPVISRDQSELARAIISRDRGRSVRTAEAYRERAVAAHLSRIDVFIDRSPLRIPYTGIVCLAYR